MSSVFLFWILEYKNREKLGKFDLFANILSLSNPQISALHGFRPWVHLVVFASITVCFAVMIAYFEAVRATGIGHGNYGIIVGLQVLAVAFASFSQRSFFWPMVLSVGFTAILFTPAINGGVVMHLISAGLGVSLILLMAALEKLKVSR